MWNLWTCFESSYLMSFRKQHEIIHARIRRLRVIPPSKESRAYWESCRRTFGWKTIENIHIFVSDLIPIPRRPCFLPSNVFRMIRFQIRIAKEEIAACAGLSLSTWPLWASWNVQISEWDIWWDITASEFIASPHRIHLVIFEHCTKKPIQNIAHRFLSTWTRRGRNSNTA